MAEPVTMERVRYGWRVMRLAGAVLRARLRPLNTPVPGDSPLPSNAMFSAAIPPALERERSTLERFDLGLCEAMNSERLEGQIVFEYGTLLSAIDRWRGQRVLDIGTGRSTLPNWMSSEGAVVTTFDLPHRAEPAGAGFQARVNGLVGRPSVTVRQVAGSMRRLPFADASFDLVTSLSVVEHLDTDLPGRAYVPYEKQRRRLGDVIDEMIRVTAHGGHLYLTSDCCDFERATTDGWKSSYYCLGGPALSGAWPVQRVSELFYEYIASRGCELVGGIGFAASDIDRADHWTWRGPYFSGFSVLARKR